MTGDPQDPDSPHTFPFRTSWHTLSVAGEPSSVIRISNLSTTISGPADAWGREDRPQPFSISVEVSLGEPFIDSSRGDVLKNDTVHYGLLSKHVMKTVEKTKYGTLDALVSYVRGALLGPPVGDPGAGDPAEGFLDGKGVRYLKIRARLPKASKLGTGVSIVDSLALHGGIEVVSWSRTLAFHDLRVPVLIGVNDNERQAKQIVVANIEVDRWAPQMEDAYPSLEDIITNVSPALSPMTAPESPER